MKSIQKHLAKILGVLSIWLLMSTMAHAQETMDIDFALRNNVLWYEQPWVWIAAACLFLWMLVMVLRRNDDRDSRV